MTSDAVTPGVQFNAPPSHLFADVLADLKAATLALGDDDAAIVAVADRQGGWNAALVVKGPGGINVKAWIREVLGRRTDQLRRGRRQDVQVAGKQVIQ